jgi:hypothetical protein
MRAPIFHAVPVLAPDAGLERKPVLGDGEFEWGYVLTRGGSGAETPLSGLVALVVSRIDGERSVAAILAELARQIGPEQMSRVLPSVLVAIQILYVDGAIDELRGI